MELASILLPSLPCIFFHSFLFLLRSSPFLFVFLFCFSYFSPFSALTLLCSPLSAHCAALRPSSVRSCRLIIESEEVHRSDFFKARSVDFYQLRPQTRPTSVLLVLSATRRSHQRHHPATTRRCVALTRLRVDLTLLRVYSTRRRVDLLHRPVASPACSSTTLFRRCWSFLFLVVFSVYFRSFCCVLLLCLCCLGYRLQVLTVFDLLLETFVTEFLLLVLSFGCSVPTLLSGARCATAAPHSGGGLQW